MLFNISTQEQFCNNHGWREPSLDPITAPAGSILFPGSNSINNTVTVRNKYFLKNILCKK